MHNKKFKVYLSENPTGMKKMKTTYKLFVTIAAMFLVLTGVAYADIPINGTPSTIGITTSTVMNAQGISTTTTALGLQLGTSSLNDPPLENGGYPWEWWAGEEMPLTPGYSLEPWVAEIYGTPVPPGEIQYTAGYNEDTTAVSGSLNYVKTMSVSTANKAAGQDNIAGDRILTFVGGDGGRMTSNENILIDGAGAQTIAAEHMLCPFAIADNQFFPPFCNIVTSGSNVDISVGSVATSASGRFIAQTADAPVQVSYQINAKGINGPNGYTDASGTISAFMKAHIQESREEEIPRYFDTDPIGFTPTGKVEDLTYSESSFAGGRISSFSKTMVYKSGIRMF